MKYKNFEDVPKGVLEYNSGGFSEDFVAIVNKYRVFCIRSEDFIGVYSRHKRGKQGISKGMWRDYSEFVFPAKYLMPTEFLEIV